MKVINGGFPKMKVNPHSGCYATGTDGYQSFHDAMYATYLGMLSPDSGVKLHLSVRGSYDALVAAEKVLPVLIGLNVAHKIVRTYERYLHQLTIPDVRGKFITIYTANMGQAGRILKEVEYSLNNWGVKRGPIPVNRVARPKVPEDPIGRSGLLTMRFFKKDEQPELF
jgi:hypothetical protein